MTNIEKAIEKSGLSQKEIAISLGVSQPAISNWRSGKKYPSGKNLQQLALLLNTSVDYLLGRSENPLPETQVQHDTDLAILLNKLRKDPLAIEVTRFFLNLSPEKKEAAKTVLFTAFGE